MKLDDAPTIISIPPASATSTFSGKKDGSVGGVFGRTRYKFWVLTALLLLAFWSMVTGSVTLKWSTGNFSAVTDDLDFRIHDDDLDILEVEEKEKLVKHLWDLYIHGSAIKVPRFWQQAFEAAYEALASDVAAVRDAAVSEIAKLSLSSFYLDPPHVPAKPVAVFQRSFVNEKRKGSEQENLKINKSKRSSR